MANKKVQRDRYTEYKAGDLHNTLKLVEKVKYLHQEGFSYYEAMAELRKYCDVAMQERFPDSKFRIVEREGFQNGIAQCALSAIDNNYDAEKIADDLYMEYLRIGKREGFLEEYMYTTDFLDSFNEGIQYFKDNV
ncbi:MAG: hypothetical protein K0S61_2554 [Anaerocolumna sp.]|jgi:hypothetical protein|nr:hypothetical protein [Anaerocolumna sp.]